MWPFGKKKGASPNADSSPHRGTTDQTEAVDQDGSATSAVNNAGEAAETSESPTATVSPTDGGSRGSDFDPVNGDFGPFDGDSVDYREFNFSDFAKGGLDLGSMLIPVPHTGEVQVEMGTDGPRQIHLLTPHGRITPAAFAAPRSGGQWESDIDGFAESMAADGLTVTRRSNDWGIELVGAVGDGVVRVIGVDGPRWMLRMTLAGPATSAEELAELTYEVISRTFVNRGKEPAPAGRALPVVIPPTMAEELQRTIAAQAQANQAQSAQAQAPEETSAPSDPSSEAAKTAPRRRTGGTAERQMGDSQ